MSFPRGEHSDKRAGDREACHSRSRREDHYTRYPSNRIFRRHDERRAEARNKGSRYGKGPYHCDGHISWREKRSTTEPLAQKAPAKSVSIYEHVDDHDAVIPDAGFTSRSSNHIVATDGSQVKRLASIIVSSGFQRGPMADNVTIRCKSAAKQLKYSSPPRPAATSDEQVIGALSDIGVMEEDGGGEDLLLEDDLFDDELMDIEDKTQEMESSSKAMSSSRRMKHQKDNGKKGLLPSLIRWGEKEGHGDLTVGLGG
ncbi:unnamed protein product [Eruca vesicaria subsp. sativa]|uniref:Uncharacterized protein n=1 Tax=Eruca vesicaria subsp. sativa TaxID=29727 RepID=A0ABC8JPA0_ERUVS|nr:unnamed protein product [Eruca vesicaria subsp. sativa]